MLVQIFKCSGLFDAKLKEDVKGFYKKYGAASACFISGIEDSLLFGIRIILDFSTKCRGMN